MRLLLALLAFALLATGCGQSEAGQAIRRGPKPAFHAWVALTGSSMLPQYLKTGYVEVDMNYPFEKVAVGDDVVFWDYNRAGGDKFTFHRVIGRDGDHYVTQGINRATNPRADTTLVDRNNYQGRATGRYSVVLLPPISDAP